MTDRLRQVRERLDTVAQLEMVMTAMRGIAATHLREAHAQLTGIRAYTATIGMAIGDVLDYLPQQIEGAGERDCAEATLLIVLSAEQGFAGTFNERIVDELEAQLVNVHNTQVLLVGSRGASVARERDIPLLHTRSMATRVQAIPKLAVSLTDQLYQRLARDGYSRVSLLHPEYTESTVLQICHSSLIPFDFSRFTAREHALPPILTMRPLELARQLAQEYLYAELCNALMMTHAAENQARVHAMVRARANVIDTRQELQTDYQLLRQEQITAEIAELTIGRLAGS